MFANNSEFFDASHGQSVIVRQPQQQPPPDEEFGSPFPVTSTSCLPSTPLTPGYSGYSGQFPFPFFPPELAQTFAQSFLPPPDHLPNIGNLNSPLIPGTTFGGGLNHLNNRFGNTSRSNLQYNFPDSGNFMGGSKPRKGGRRPGDEMVSDDCGDPDEMEKRLKRRQRNKEAAARCRQRRLDLMQTLQEQVAREKEQNMLKEKEIANVRQTLDAVVDFLRVHLGHLPDIDRAKFEEIVATLGKEQSNGVIFKNEPTENQSGNDYLPQQSTRSQHHVGSKRALLPPTSDVSILEPELKVPKIEFNPTLSSVNGGGGDPEVTRPTTLDISGLRGSTAPLATPSNGLTSLGYALPSFRHDPNMYTSLFGDNGTSHFLTQSTGLTPSGAPTVGFVAQTPTPLQTSEADLRPL